MRTKIYKLPERRYEVFIRTIYNCKRSDIREASDYFFNKCLNEDESNYDYNYNKANLVDALNNAITTLLDGYHRADITNKLEALKGNVYNLNTPSEFNEFVDAGLEILEDIKRRKSKKD